MADPYAEKRVEAAKLLSDGLSVMEVAARVDVHRDTVNRWRQKMREPTKESVSEAIKDMELASLRARLRASEAARPQVVPAYSPPPSSSPEARWKAAELDNAERIRRCLLMAKFSVELPNEPCAITFISDQHISLGNCVDLERMRQDAELVAETEGCYAVLGGDAIDNHCLDEESQVLTRRGWLYWWQVGDGDECLGFSEEFGSAWQPIDRVISSDYSGEMFGFKTESLDIKCTPGHRMVYRGMDFWGKPSGCLKYSLASDIKGLKQIPIAADLGMPEMPDITDAELRVVGLVMTDGWITQPTQRHKKRKFHIAQRESNSRYVRDALNDAGLEFSVYRKTVEQANKSGGGTASVNGRRIVATEDLLTFGILAKHSARLAELIADKKSIPLWVYSLSRRQFLVLLEAIIEGDGSYNGRGHILYGKHAFLDEIQAACVMHGIAARKVDYHRCENDGRLLICPHRKYQQLCVRRCTTTEHYSGKVWCLNVGTGNFLARRNGGPFFTGNCKHRAAVLAARSQPSDQWELMEWYLSIFQGRILVAISGNHEAFTVQLSGSDVLSILLKKNQVCYAPDECMIDVSVGPQKYKVAVRHQYRLNSSFNECHACKQWFRMGEETWDCGVIGHNHVAAVESFYAHGLERWAIRPGSYQITSAYSRQYGYNKTCPRCPTVVFSPSTREMVAFHDIRPALIYLKAVRGK